MWYWSNRFSTWTSGASIAPASDRFRMPRSRSTELRCDAVALRRHSPPSTVSVKTKKAEVERDGTRDRAAGDGTAILANPINVGIEQDDDSRLRRDSETKAGEPARQQVEASGQSVSTREI